VNTVAAVTGLLIAVGCITGIAALLWTCTDGYTERLRIKKALNDIKLEQARRQMDLDLKLREWEHTASLEDLTRHRQHLLGELEQLHAAEREHTR
jgi:hypothetical protein